MFQAKFEETENCIWSLNHQINTSIYRKRLFINETNCFENNDSAILVCHHQSIPWSVTITLRCYSPVGATKNLGKKLPLKHMAEWPMANIMQQSYVENKQNIDRFKQMNENKEYLPICESYYQQVSPSVHQHHQY